MATEPLTDDEYASEEDSDFAPEAAPVDGASEASESEVDGDDAQPSTSAKRKRTAGDADGADFENSGDEAIISKGRKRQRKAKANDVPTTAGDEEGGEGGLIKTRSMRAVEKAERKEKAVTGPVTIDVNDLWAQMTAAPVIPAKSNANKENKAPGVVEGGGDDAKAQPQEERGDLDSSAMVKIKRTYNFAGKVHTEEKMVARNSAEAKLYFESQEGAKAEGEDEDDPTKRKPRQAFRSRFEPLMEGLTLREDLNLGMNVRLQMREQAKAKKLNVVEKSRLDWAGFVDKEGIQDELKLAGKSKESFANRQDFLSRVEANREDEARKARMAARG